LVFKYRILGNRKFQVKSDRILHVSSRDNLVRLGAVLEEKLDNQDHALRQRKKFLAGSEGCNLSACMHMYHTYDAVVWDLVCVFVCVFVCHG